MRGIRKVRLDAVVHYRRNRPNAADAREKVWRVQAAVGARSWLQAGVYAGRFDFGRGLFERGNTFGGTLRLRPVTRMEAYATLNYRPISWFDRYPAFNLARGSIARTYLDLTDNTYEDDASLHLGVRVVF